jgi:hypothetical protein
MEHGNNITNYIARSDEQQKSLVQKTLHNVGELASIKDQRHLTESEEFLMNDWMQFVKENIHILFKFKNKGA